MRGDVAPGQVRVPARGERDDEGNRLAGIALRQRRGTGGEGYDGGESPHGMLLLWYAHSTCPRSGRLVWPRARRAPRLDPRIQRRGVV